MKLVLVFENDRKFVFTVTAGQASALFPASGAAVTAGASTVTVYFIRLALNSNSNCKSRRRSTYSNRWTSLPITAHSRGISRCRCLNNSVVSSRWCFHHSSSSRGSDFFSSSIRHEEFLGEDTSLWVIEVIAGVSCCCWVADLSKHQYLNSECGMKSGRCVKLTVPGAKVPASKAS